MKQACYHLPGLFEFYDLYSVFLPLYYEHREWFYDWCEIGSIYGSPTDCIWGGGRVEMGERSPREVLALTRKYGISARLTFSNSLLNEEHLSDRRCNELCRLFGAGAVLPVNRSGNENAGERDDRSGGIRQNALRNGIIIYSDILLDYIRKRYPGFYFVSSTTKVLTAFDDFKAELDREEFEYVVPDFRLNKSFDRLNALNALQKGKVEFLCNECCSFECGERKRCYEAVSRKNLGEPAKEHHCTAPGGDGGYRFSRAMTNQGFIGMKDITDTYLPMGFTNFKIEGRGLGSAVVLEFLLYYMTKPEYHLKVREEIYLDTMLDLF